MAGVWKELYFERGINETASGSGRTRGWSVTGVGPDIARTDPEAVNRGDVHPDYPLLVAENVIYTPTGYGTSVRASYVPVEFLEPIPPENTTDLDWTRIDTDHEDEDVDIPVFERVTKSFPGPNDTVTEQMVWQRRDNVVPFRKSVVVHRLQINAEVVSGLGAASAIAISDIVTAQHNKIHTILGRKMLFQADGSRRTSKDQYQFNYRWIEDSGIPYLEDHIVIDNDGPTTGPGFAKIGSEAFPVASIGFVIPPFSLVRTSPVDGDPEAVPVVTVSLAFEEDPDGYLTLPGIG